MSDRKRVDFLYGQDKLSLSSAQLSICTSQEVMNVF